MPVDELPGQILVPDRDALRDQYLRDYRFHGPAGVNTASGSQPYIDASVFADQALPVWAAVQTAGNNLVLTEAQGDAADAWAAASGTSRTPATPSSGFVVAQTSTTGASVAQSDQLGDTNGNLYNVTTGGAYLNGALIPIEAATRGLAGNIPGGTVLTWSAPRPGCGPVALVFTNADGSGLSGGAAEETDDELVARIISEKQNPPASGNDAAYQAAAQNISGLAVQKAFTYPAIRGPGTTGMVFTMAPSSSGASRLPNAAQVSQMEAAIVGQFPADDGLLLGTISPQNVDVVLEVDWQTGAASWADVTPWPAYYPLVSTFTPTAIVVIAAGGPLAVTLGTKSGAYPAGVVAPQPGNRVAFFNPATGTFLLKTIAAGSVTGSGPWGVTFDGTNNNSDTTFTPAVGDRVMPWSTSLQSLVPTVQQYFAGLGPGEQSSSFPDPGRRLKRSPPPTSAWPSSITNRLPAAIESVSGVGDVAMVEPAVPLAPAVGEPGVLSYLLVLNHISVFPL